ncbi:putative glycosyltransferase [Mariniradius saccharolyticus AK6]|uniref:Glycosyltransferase n=1 Tax=Mariniradius saccharolyticus AK6 TaxID=1239962 RepID=M7XBP7_9BACT|nr:glycosyltransferase family A protein [Mariniradius saccharolyticus]EMS32304.1 putative glycosyltransferase [Mariniradius saccharolyticus AK6]
MKPLASIIIPVYNKAAYIRETLDSALVQSYTNFEIVLVNDGSTDGSLSILQEYADRFPAIVRLINSENRGVSAATNLGIQAASGDYIQFLDADDLMSSDKIERQIQLLSGKGSATIATCEWVNFKDDIHHYRRVLCGVFRDFDSGLDLLLRFWNHQEMMAISSYLTHRDLIQKAGPWDESLTINQDGEFFCRILLKAKEVLFEPKGMVYYRKPGQDNVSQQKSEKAARSLLDSVKSYEKSVLEVEDSIRVRLALKKVYQKYVYDIFPNYRGLLIEARSRMGALGVKENTYIGGPKFQFMSRFLGFENALRLKRFIG